MMGYYDIVLGLIPVSLVGVTTSLIIIGLPLTVAVLPASMIALGLMGHAMFINSPVSKRYGREHSSSPDSTAPNGYSAD